MGEGTDLLPAMPLAAAAEVFSLASVGDAFAEIATSGSLLLAVPVALAAGVVSFLSPCMLPLLPGYLSYVTGLSGTDVESWRDSPTPGRAGFGDRDRHPYPRTRPRPDAGRGHVVRVGV